MTKLIKLNESFFQIQSNNKGLLQEIKDRFSFPIENRKYHPLVRRGKWDGIIRLLTYDNKLYLGLLPEAISLLRSNKEEFELVGFDNKEVNVSSESVHKFIDEIILSSDGKKITPHEHQINSLIESVLTKRKVLLSATSSGKSISIYLYIRWLLDNEPGRQILLIVPSVQLVYQLYKDFEDYSTLNGFEVGEYVQIMHDDSIKEILRSVVIVNVQAIQNQPKEWFLPFDTIIHDEVHRAKAKTFKTVLENCINADRRVGLTGTLDGVEVNELIIKGLIGKTKNIISTKELIEVGLGTPLVIKMIMLKYPKKFIPKLKPADYSAEVNFLAAVPERREYIYNLLDSITGNTLIIFSLVEKHLEPMLKEYKKRNPKKKVFVVDGTVPIEKREEIRVILESSNDNVVFCSYGTFSTGINIKNIKNLVMAIGAKSRIRVKQTLGRLVRKHVSKDKAFVYDIVDDLRQGTGGRPNSCFLHGKARLEYYKEDGHKIIFKHEDIS